MSLDYVSNQEIIQAARRNLSQDVWDYLTGGAESETTMRRNRLGFDSLGLRPRVLVDVSKVDTSITFLGQKLRIPVMLAPMGSLQTMTPEGGVAVGKAAAEFGSMNFVSSVTQPSLEEIAAATTSRKSFSSTFAADLDWCAGIIGRAKKAGYMALCLPSTRRITAGASDRCSTAGSRRAGIGGRAHFSSDAHLGDGCGNEKNRRDATDHQRHRHRRGRQARRRSRRRCHLHFQPRRAATGPWTRDHRHAAGNRCSGERQSPIVLDGGVTRGTDVVKALALGATAVNIGKLQGWGLGAGGQAGLVKVLELLEEEITIDMALMGVTRVDQLNPKYVCKAAPVIFAHEMSAFIHIPGSGQLR